MKTAPTRRGRFYIRYLLVSAFIFGCLLINSVALAQKKVPGQFPNQWFTSTEAPDNKYGEGGTRATMVDEMNRVRTKVWTDKDGKTREVYQFVPDYPKAGNWYESWSFYVANDKTKTLSYSGKEKSDVGDFSLGEDRHQHRPDMRREEAVSLIEEVEKQFAKNGTVPSDMDILDEVDEKGKEVGTKVEQPDLSKVPQVSANKDCEGLREKVRTLQDLLRARQADPASPKQELETIRKQIDALLDRLADCPKQEPIDAQFDCLKSKFPEVRLMVGKKDRAWDPTSKRDFDWDADKQAWIDGDTKESICPPSGIDPCLVGTWECTSFKEANKFITGGGTGFRVTFKSDGTETVDYSKMQPIRAGNDKMVYEGKATARISAKDGVAKIENMIDAAAKFNAAFMLKRYGKEYNPKLPELGPGGLGTTKGKNSYKCTGDSLEYQSSTPRGEADCTVTLRKCTQEAQKDQDQPKLPPNEDSEKRDGKDKKPWDRAAFDKAMADVDASIKAMHSLAEKQKCEGLQSEIRQLQDSLVAMGEKTASWNHQLSDSDRRISSIKGDIREAEREKDEDKRGKKLDLLNFELSHRDSINAKISGMQSEREQVRKKIDDLLNKLADCKSKP